MVDPGAPLTGERRAERNKEIDELLNLAEQLDRRTDRIRTLGFAFALLNTVCVIGAIAALFMALNTAFSGKKEFVFYSQPLVAGAGSVGFGIYVFSQISRLSQRQRREGRALAEVVSILREMERVLEEDRDWTVLQRAMFRIRLSRIGVDRNTSARAQANLTTQAYTIVHAPVSEVHAYHPK